MDSGGVVRTGNDSEEASHEKNPLALEAVEARVGRGVRLSRHAENRCESRRLCASGGGGGS